jgi:hypothetical protein
VLLEVLLHLLPLIADAFDGLLCILMNSWVASIGALNDINTVIKGQPRVRSATPIATKNATAGCATGLVGPFISALILTDGLLGLAGIYLGGECLTCANGFTGDGPDVGILHLGTDGCLEHLLEDLALVSGCASLQLAVIGEMGAKAGEEARVKAIHKGLVLILAGAVFYCTVTFQNSTSV